MASPTSEQIAFVRKIAFLKVNCQTDITGFKYADAVLSGLFAATREAFDEWDRFDDGPQPGRAWVMHRINVLVACFSSLPDFPSAAFTEGQKA